MSTIPAQPLMSRRTRILLPITETPQKQQVPKEEEQQRPLHKRQETQARYYNRNARDHPKLQMGDVVRMKPINNFERVWHKATVKQKLEDRSYMVETSERGTYRRNRFLLRKTGEPRTLPHPDMPVEPVVSPDKAPAEASPKQEPATSNGRPPPPVVREQTKVRPRPVRERRPPSYLKDYFCNMFPLI